MSDVILLLVGAIVGGLVSHKLERHRWLRDARFKTYVQFAQTARTFATANIELRNAMRRGEKGVDLLPSLTSEVDDVRRAGDELERLGWEVRLVGGLEAVYRADEMLADATTVIYELCDDPIVVTEQRTAHEYTWVHHETVDAWIDAARIELGVGRPPFEDLTHRGPMRWVAERRRRAAQRRIERSLGGQ